MTYTTEKWWPSLQYCQPRSDHGSARPRTSEECRPQATGKIEIVHGPRTYISNSKVIPQVAECLAQFDPVSGITSKAPLFSPDRLAETLVAGYFAMLGVMCSDQRGIHILIRWKIINMFYHIVELKDRDDLIRALLTNLDYTLDSHPRIILSKAMIAGSKQMRITATRMLRKYAMMPIQTQTVVGGGAVSSVGLDARWNREVCLCTCVG